MTTKSEITKRIEAQLDAAASARDLLADDPEAAAQVLLSVLINGLSPIAGSGT